MATLKAELRAILERYGIDPRDNSQIWDCHGTLVLYHKAYEIIAAKEKITFSAPQMIRSEKDEAVIIVTGTMGDRSEWSFGEAAIGLNYLVKPKQSGYPYAMAEKRGKDRVIGKLVGLAPYVYSEDEAEDFKNGDREAVEPSSPPPAKVTESKQPKPKPDPQEFWKRQSLDLDPKRQKSYLQFADSFEKALAAAPNDKAINRLARDNDGHLELLQQEDRALANALLEKLAERQAQGAVG